ncbi:MAG: Trm112 family protein [Nanoarchaeota archaeon]
MIDKELMNILACPKCKSGLKELKNSLVCNSCRTKYRVKNGIPIFV